MTDAKVPSGCGEERRLDPTAILLNADFAALGEDFVENPSLDLRIGFMSKVGVVEGRERIDYLRSKGFVPAQLEVQSQVFILLRN